MTYDEIRAHLNLDHIAAAARWAAKRLHQSDSAIVELSPGDMTVYKIIVTNPQDRWTTTAVPFAPVIDAHRDYWVVLANFNHAYPWGGQMLHEDYVIEKWSGGNKWTATVMTAFLNELSDRITEERHQ